MSDPVRIDKWLWAARFFKTRGLASDAIKEGRVKVNGTKAKPAKDVKAGDQVEVLVGGLRKTVDVRQTSDRRGPATVAALLYTETPESVEKREEQLAQRRAMGPPPAYDQRGGRPTKRNRRRYEELQRRSRDD